MELFSRNDLIAGIQDASLLLHLDDDSDGAEDSGLLASVHDDALNWINGYLQQAGIELPVSIPARLKHSAVKYAEYSLWTRRGGIERAKSVYDQWIKPAMVWLERIARGEETLVPPDVDDTPAGAIVEAAKTTNSSGGLMI
jgi:phage gp36-like protein